MPNQKIWDVIIIGAGPAGLTAAVYTSRANIKTLIIEKDAPGGKMVKTWSIENWPGEEEINGADLAMKMYNHAMKFGTEYHGDEVSEIKQESPYHRVVCKSGTTFLTKSVLIASGMVERKLGVPGELELEHKGVSYCAVCDAALYKNQPIAIIGGGDSAVEEANFVAGFASHVYVVHRRQGFRAKPQYLKKLQGKKNVSFILDAIVKTINGEDEVNSITWESTIDKKRMNLEISAVFPYIGLDPVTGFASEQILTPDKFINVNSKMETNIPGIYSAGDCNKKNLYQITTAVNDGAIAAQTLANYIDTIK